MEITRDNYEEYFLLYVDNELNALERKAVEVFVQENPDLEEELVMLQQSILQPDDNQVFVPKEYLLKNTSKQGLVNEGNYEEYFVLYGDDELTNQQKDLVEQFVYKFPQYQAEFELIQQARLFPETIHFADKQDLYRSEEDDNRVVPFAWWRMVAAAIVILTIGGLTLFVRKNEAPIVKVPTAKTQTPAATPQIVHETPAIVKAEKKSADESNIISRPRVQPIENAQQMVAKQEPIIINTSLSVKPVEVEVANTKPVEDNAISTMHVSAPANATALVAAMPTETIPTVAAASEENIETTAASTHYILNAPVNKTPLRGLFRKISRVVDKATTVERDENGKGGVRIANFEIALK